MNKLKMIALETTTLSALMSGREKKSTEEIIEEFDGIITITEVDMVDDGKSKYPVILFDEDKNAFYCGGIVLRRIVEAWDDYCGGIDKVNENLLKDPVKVKLESARTKDGKNSITRVSIL